MTVQTGHKPLVSLINTRDLDRVPIRCQRLLIRLLRYQVQAVYVPGKSMTVADTLSRAPLPTDQEDDVLQQETTALIYAVTRALCSPEKQRLLVDATTNDPMLQRVVHYTVHGWPTTISDQPHQQQQHRQLHRQELKWTLTSLKLHYAVHLEFPYLQHEWTCNVY